MDDLENRLERGGEEGIEARASLTATPSTKARHVTSTAIISWQNDLERIKLSIYLDFRDQRARMRARWAKPKGTSTATGLGRGQERRTLQPATPARYKGTRTNRDGMMSLL